MLMKRVYDGKGFKEYPYETWLKEFPWADQQDVIIQREDKRLEFGWVGTHYRQERKGGVCIPEYLIGGGRIGRVVAYMYIPTIDVDRTSWHGDYTDGMEPKCGENPYLVSVEVGRNIVLKSAVFFSGKWITDLRGEVLGWRKYPKPYKGM